MHFQLHTDHKPLVSLLGSKALDSLPVHVQRFRLRLMRFKYTISHVPGKDLSVADALSRAPLSEVDESLFAQEVDAYVRSIVDYLPISETRLKQVLQSQEEDPVCQRIKDYCRNGWPPHNQVDVAVKPYYQAASELTMYQDLLMRGNQILIPSTMRKEILTQIHTGHQGITKCRERARQSVWWPGINRDLGDLILNCPECYRERQPPVAPLNTSTLPNLPWETVATDQFHWNGSKYLLVVDYFSRFIEIAQLRSEISEETIHHLKNIFARHGIPVTVVSDNGLQFSSREFRQFSKLYGFTHRTSSPKHPQGNGEAERAVKTIKCLLKKESKPQLALLSYRATQLRNGYSPAELLMGRKLRTTVPIIPKLLHPTSLNYSRLAEKEKYLRKKQKATFDGRHWVREPSVLSSGDSVWIPDTKTRGTIERQVSIRSYLVSTPLGSLRRNREHLRPIPTQNTIPENDDAIVVSSQITPSPSATSSMSQSLPSTNDTAGYRTRSGRVSLPPNRYCPT